MKRKINFAAGPSMLPLSVLEEVREAMLDFEGHGYSILELNHRSAVFAHMRDELKQRIRRLMNVPLSYDILFCPGGGRLQFSMVPLNLLSATGRGGYVVTGKWSQMALEECEHLRAGCTLWSGPAGTLPQETIVVPTDIDYVYYCDNETVDGTEFTDVPPLNRSDVNIVVDMSSNFMSRPVEVSRYAAIWAGVQKNFGTAGLSVLIVRHNLLERALEGVPLLLDWNEYFKTDSVPNTVPVLQFYVALLMSRWIEKEGGLKKMDAKAKEKSALIYETIDRYPDVYISNIAPSCRSRMNAVFTLVDETFLESFVQEAEALDMINLRGHRSRGGLRVSLYNAMSTESVEKLAEFMKRFADNRRRK